MAGIILRGFEVDVETFVGGLEVFPGLEIPTLISVRHSPCRLVIYATITMTTIRTYEFVLHDGAPKAS